MQLPEELQQGIDQIFENVSPVALRKARESLTRNYRAGGISPFSDEASRLVYLGARMPATFAAVHKVLQQVPLQGHLLDLGAGPGTATWAALSLYDLERITLIEESKEAISLGKQLLSSEKTTWVHQNLAGPIPKADAAILSFVIGELSNPIEIVLKCWDAVDTLILIEPGTPKAFSLMKTIRTRLGAHIIAPCPHANSCPNDWCHFSARVERTRLHRLLKEGSLGHEDEKFCYLIASKQPGKVAEARIIRHPIKQPGHVRLTLCQSDGTIGEQVISRKDKEQYRKARRSEWGDSI